jgi:hypothetical protein
MEEDFPEDEDEEDALEPSSSKFKFGALCDQSTDLLCSRSYRCGCFSSCTSSFIFFFDDHDGEKRRSSPSSTKAAPVVVAVVLAPRGMVPTTPSPMLLKSKERRSNAHIHDRERIILSLFGLLLLWGSWAEKK